jgi:hydrogenase maturation protease
MRPRILIAGIGNIFLGDDGFGCEVAKRLAERQMPDEVRAVDFGIRGFDLAYALMDGYDAIILVDTTVRGGEPGTLYAIEPELSELDEQTLVETHGMNPVRVLSVVKAMGGELKRIILVGCEPATIGSDEAGQIGLSRPVQAAVDEAVKLIESLVAGILEKNTLRTEEIV